MSRPDWTTIGLGAGAAVGLVLVGCWCVKLYRENREARQLMEDDQTVAFMDAFHRAHPEARPLPKWFIITAFAALFLTAVILLVLLVISLRP